MKNYLLPLFAILTCGTATAEPISKSQAASIAAKYMLSVNMKASELQQVGANSGVRKANGLDTTDQPYYVFNSDDNAGFVVVAGDDLLPEIVGYSNKGAFHADSMADGLKFYLNCYSEYVRRVQNGSISPRKAPQDNDIVVEPLLKTEWDQTYPYNKYAPSCPGISKNCKGRYPIGCVAVAVGQVMNYWQWPKAIDPKGDLFIATEAIYEGEYVVDYANDTLDLTKSVQPDYDWSNMTDRFLTYNNADNVENYEVKAEAVGTLLRDVAYAMSMEWADYGGGTYTKPDVMTKYFGYSKDCHDVFADMLEGSYESDVWLNMIIEDLVNKRPIVYSGSSSEGGHCFVFDGLDAANRVHVNWGWGGYGNGWYDVTCLNSEKDNINDKGEYNFSFESDALFNLHPNKDGVEETITPRTTDVTLFDFLLYPFGHTGNYLPINTNDIRKVINPERPNTLCLSFLNGTWISGINFDYQYLFSAEDGTEKTIEVKNVMSDENTNPAGYNCLFDNDLSLNSVFSLKNGTYQITYRNNIYNDKGDETGFVDYSMPCCLIKEDDQCILINDANNYNSIFHEAQTTGDVKYWKNVFTFDDLDNLVEGQSTKIVFDSDFPTTSLEPFDLEASSMCYLNIKSRTTGKTLWTKNVDKKTFKNSLLNKEADKLCGSNSAAYIIEYLPADDYTLTLNYPLFKMAFTKDFTVKGTTSIENIQPSSSPEGDNVSYNIAGQRVGSNYRGLVIINGKKVSWK